MAYCSYLVDLWCSGIRPDIDHVDSGGDEWRQNQTVSFLGGIIKAAAAGVPAGVMQLVTKVRHRQPVDYLQGQRSKVTTGQSREFKFYSDFIYLHISMRRIYAFQLFKRWFEMFKNMAKWCRKTVKQILQIRDRKQKPEGGRGGEDSRTSGWKTNPAGGKSWRETKSKTWPDATYHQDSLINLAIKMPRQQIGAEDCCLEGQAGDRITPSTWQ